jgi:hypothetical protein
LKRAVQAEQQLAANLAQLKAKMAGSAGPMVTLRELERTAASARQVYEQFLLRAQETSEQASIDSTNVTKTNPAKPADESEGSSRKVLAIGGFVGGFVFGLGLAILKGIWEALAARFGGQNSFRGAAPTPQPPRPRSPITSSRSGRRFLRGSFQPPEPNHSEPVPVGAAATASLDDKSNAMYPYPPMMPQPYPPLQTWGQPVPQPTPYPTAPVMTPHMYAQPHMVPQPVYYPQQQYAQPLMQPQFMPQPVIVHNYPAQPLPTQTAAQPVRVADQHHIAAEAKGETMQPRPHRPLPTNADIDDIREQLADMRAELMDLARQRRRA